MRCTIYEKEEGRKKERRGREEKRREKARGDATDAPRNVHNRFLFSEEGLPVSGRQVRGNGNLEPGVGFGLPAHRRS